jgi:catechol 2,3-dioxygenase-like lactoylglutathione lyase family enzyme
VKVVPELLCRDIEATTDFYCRIFGFEVVHERPEERFAYFTKDGVDIMAEQFDAPGRHWITGNLEPPFGRGVNFQWEVRDIGNLYQRVRSLSPDSIYMAIETKTYECGENSVSQRQFLVQDLDGYLFRFCEEQNEGSEELKQ